MAKPLNQTCKKIKTGREGLKDGRNGCKAVKRHKLLVIKSIHGDIKSSMVAVVNKTVSHI